MIVPRNKAKQPDPLMSLPTEDDLERDPAAALASLPTEDDLPYSDECPMDSPWHRAAMNQLIDSIEQHWFGRKDFFVGGDMFVYFSPEHVFNKDFRGPDFFVVLNTNHDKPRKSWISWREKGKLPTVIVELASESTVHVDRGEKKRLYAEEFGTREYFIYDPATHTAEGWRLNDVGVYEPLNVDPSGRIASHSLGMWIGPWKGTFQANRDTWPRFFTPSGDLVLTFAEAEKLRSTAEKKKADAEKKKADTEKKKADAATKRADAAEAELARVRAELEALKQSKRTK